MLDSARPRPDSIKQSRNPYPSCKPSHTYAAHIPMYLYPFLNTVMSKSRPFEYLRLTSLGVIGALVKARD